MRALKLTRFRKAIAVFLLLTFLNQIFIPSVAFALTAGPTSPEATSFEPIDTTDMVNLLTGDFTYNIPLLEVPGPEGGYPLSLSYHAGIQPNEEASWVGLGWTLNPGAITRNINGYPDDFSNVTTMRRDYWQGGSRESLGITVGLPVGVAFGLSFSNDTYQGFAVGKSIGIGVNLGSLRIGYQAGMEPFGDTYSGLQASLSTGLAQKQGLQLGINIGLSTNFESISTNAGMGVSYKAGGDEYSLTGASISSTSSKGSLSIGGITATVHNQNAGKIQTKSSGFEIPGFIGLSYNYQRYWSDEKVNVFTNGSLNMPQRQTDQSYFNNRTYDIYRLLDPKNFRTYTSPDQLQGGTFPAFDDYSVTAQGLSGNMRPHIYQSILYSQNTSDVVQTSGAPANNLQFTGGVQYRFINDFSNSYRQPSPNMTGLAFEFGTPIYGNNDGNYGYNTATNRLEGSRHIKWFTNSEINTGSASSKGFINTSSAGFIRMGQAGGLSNTSGSQQVGGFMITNASGVTYHYALPAYSYNEYTYTSNLDNSKWTSQTKPEPYAYTWYLTAITGPDFVDRGTIGVLDDQDWGYWISFEYGKWTNQYGWRNPSEDYHKDLQKGYKSYSKGTKEVYYLDAVRTRTHTALFVKQIRADGKSYNGSFQYSVNSCPVGSLRLNTILLLKNDQINNSLNLIRKASTVYNFSNYSGGAKVHEGTNVIDVNDIAQLGEELTQKCLRKIDFNFDYSLNVGVPNSYDASGYMYSTSPGSPPNSQKLGKLTLNSVDFRGKGGLSVSPPLEFTYDLDSSDPLNQDYITISQVPANRKGTIQMQAGRFEKGDIVKFTISGIEYYCTILSKSGTLANVLYLNRQPTSAGGGATAVKTKNPPYDRDAYDIWGLYKSDYISSANENLSRLTSSVSNTATDVWSLRKIKTNLGSDIKIKYEGDTYRRPVLNRNLSMIINSVAVFDANTSALNIESPGTSLTEIFKVGDKVDFMLFQRTSYDAFPRPWTYRTVSTKSFDNLPVVTAVTANQLRIRTSNSLGEAIKGSGADICENMTGNLGLNGASLFYGGGLRVKGIEIDNIFGSSHQTEYDYSMLSTSNEQYTSGVTSYEPVGLDVDNADLFPNSSIYRQELYKEMDNLLSISREVPVPGVMYEYVTIKDHVKTPDGVKHAAGGMTKYQFKVFNKSMVGIKEYQWVYSPNTPSNRYKNLSVKNYTAQIGNLIRSIWYDDKGNKLSETVNHYANDAIADKPFDYQVARYELGLFNYKYQGVIQERYGDGRTLIRPGGTSIYTLTMSGRDIYPSILTGTTNIDYKNGTKISTENLGYDFYSGAVTKTLTTDSYGNHFMTETTPAYRKYESLGLKVNESTSSVRKHMLTQEASSYTYKVDEGKQPLGLVSANVQTWGNDIPVYDGDGTSTTTGQNAIWRKKATYTWLTNGTSANNLTPVASFQGFFDGGSGNSAWKKTSEITKYNVYSAALEGTDINANYSATRMGYGNSKVILTGSMARHEELAYAGAEDALLSNGKFSSNVSRGTGSVVADINYAHTGGKSMRLQGGQTGFIYEVPLNSLDPNRRDYHAAVWVKGSTSAIANARLYYKVGSNAEVTPVPVLNKSAAGWYLLDLRIPASALVSGSGTLTVGCKNTGSAVDLYFDDFRFQPVTSSTTAYVYDNKSGELTHILDNNNLFIRFEYDAGGKLVKTFKEVLSKSTVPLIKEVTRHYATSLFHNTAQSRGFSRNDCGVGYIGGSVTYTVPAGKYVSSKSQADADNKALEEINVNGQYFANQNATCTLLPNAILYANNSTYDSFTATFINSATNQTFQFNVNGNSYNAQLGSLPAGNYNVTMVRSSSSQSNSYVITISNYTQYYYYHNSAVYFYNVQISPNSYPPSTITIGYY